MRAVSDLRKARWLPAILLILIGTLPAATGAAEPELRIIALKHRLADEVLPALRPLLGQGESLGAHDNKLIARVSPHTLAELERMLADLDTPRRNLRINIRHGSTRSDTMQRQEAGGTWQHGNTRITVSGDPSPGQGGATLRHGNGSQVTLHSERRTTTARDHTAPFLLVRDGGHGLLRVGESIPTVQPFLVLAGHRLVVAAGIQYYDVTAGFEVEPRVIGDRVQLALHPRLAFRTNQGSQTVEFRELRTEVLVQAGEWVDLGGVVGSANEVNRQIFGVRQGTSVEDSRFLVKIDLL